MIYNPSHLFTNKLLLLMHALIPTPPQQLCLYSLHLARVRMPRTDTAVHVQVTILESLWPYMRLPVLLRVNANLTT